MRAVISKKAPPIFSLSICPPSLDAAWRSRNSVTSFCPRSASRVSAWLISLGSGSLICGLSEPLAGFDAALFVMRFLLDLRENFSPKPFTAGRRLILRAVGARAEFQLYQPSGFFAPFTQLLLQVSKALRICHDIEK